jgi:hypothetical protein
MKRFLFTVFLAFMACVCMAQTALDPLKELRYCGPPKRDKTGNIIRRADVLSAFQKAHPCPVNGNKTGACPGWAKDHVVPLACGGCDAVSNLQWLPDGMKAAASAAGVLPKDRFERSVYASTTPIADTAACTFKVIPPAPPASAASSPH